MKMRRPKVGLKFFVNLAFFILIVVFIRLQNKTKIFVKLSFADEKPKIEHYDLVEKSDILVEHSDDFVTKYSLVDFDRKTLKHPKFDNQKLQNVSNPKYVLFWTDCAFACWGTTYTQVVGNCIFTRDKNLLNVHEFDALLFHVGQIWKSYGKSLKLSWDVPKQRSSHQNYIMYTHEYVEIV